MKDRLIVLFFFLLICQSWTSKLLRRAERTRGWGRPTKFLKFRLEIANHAQTPVHSSSSQVLGSAACAVATQCSTFLSTLRYIGGFKFEILTKTTRNLNY